ncbi:Protein CBG04668 [Caenorhabditis briggsae]|uniref:Protein CBG04668 n=1 Tax=Caenorhabditis briggsae TaxID=6238 RepID=A8WY69_CAEBR|nr:Protein CBG04668 [Caenorhabditis briggsae]CAP25327.1 Protein CBG04668 [Caenorhabditis briggsae]
MSSIIEMPELVLETIIGFLNFQAVYTLRQVCKDFRSFIDDLKKSKLPDSKFKKIHIFLKNEETIRLTFIWSFGSEIEIERYFEKEKPGFFDLISQGMCLKYFENNKNCSEKEDLEFYISSPDFELSHLTSTHFEERESLSTAWGAPFECQYSRFWFFQMKNSKILKITYQCVVFKVQIWFTCIEIGNVPQGAIIQD